MIATEVSDILFGIPTPHPTMVNAGVLKKDHVNIVVHGHNPVVLEMVSAACQSSELVDLAKQSGAMGINLAGVCCTGNELLMRRGIAMAGQPSDDRINPLHRRGGYDDGGLPVYHAVLG